LLVWGLLAQILLLGTEVTQVYPNRFGSRIDAAADAMDGAV
jgi:hypothetical protein